MNITLVIPCYNEEINLQKGVLDKIGNFVEKRPDFTEVLIVDDGSTDNTKPLIKNEYLPKFKKFKLIEATHSGKAAAVIRGINDAKSEYVLFTDIDLATPIEEVDKLMNAATSTEIVIGSRSAERKGAPITRKVMALGFIFIRNIILGLYGIRDTQCGFKLFKTKAAQQIISRLKVFSPERSITGSSVSAGFDLEFLFVATKLKYKIKEIPVTWKHVETKNVHFIKDSIEALKDILRIKWLDLMRQYE